MKKTLTINLRSTVFNIDEDAYALLDDYLKNLRIYFRKEESMQEIIDDIEARIAELFTEKIKLGYDVMDIFMVKEIIKKIGNPTDFEYIENDNISAEQENKNYEQPKSSTGRKKKLYRDKDNKILGGVFSGLAHFTGWDVTAVRIVSLVLLIMTTVYNIPGVSLAFWIVCVYCVLWVVVPPAVTAEQKLEMRGEEVNLENIGKTISTPPKQGGASDVLVVFLKIILIVMAVIVGIPIIFALFICVIVFAALGLGLASISSIPFFSDFGIEQFSVHPAGYIALIFVVLIPLIVIIYEFMVSFKKIKPAATVWKISGFVLWIIALVLLFNSGVKSGINMLKNNKFNNNWVINHGNSNSGDILEESGIFEELAIDVPQFNKIVVNENLVANIILEQDTTKSPLLLLTGDSNYVKKVKWDISDDRVLTLSFQNVRFDNYDNLTIKVITPSVESVDLMSVGKIKANTKITSGKFNVIIHGAGSFSIDSLYADIVRSEIKGVGTVSLSGKIRKGTFEVNGAGKINALNVETDTVYAMLKGVGSIKTNPVKYLDAEVKGIGHISYLSEPEKKNINIEGFGKVSKE
jgi:phage shock protein PspC (stress-responsive transcriptional regulator)